MGKIPLRMLVIALGGCVIGSLVQAQQPPSVSESVTVTIGSRFSPDPVELRGLSGGTVPASEVAERRETTNGLCEGFVNEKPNHTLVLTDFFDYLSLQIQSPEDTTLIIRGPGGSWCNDDYKGKNPGIAGQWLAGTYQVWIGSHGRTRYHPYIIRISGKRP
ncbi:MAG: hypothetical protein SFW36_09235 [Leptolyngbyaceae cyanobacterium bins.59]|nr:hypothetical protein [Leptolyngbyaceae cyanobacterium bins.59]